MDVLCVSPSKTPVGSEPYKSYVLCDWFGINVRPFQLDKPPKIAQLGRLCAHSFSSAHFLKTSSPRENNKSEFLDEGHSGRMVIWWHSVVAAISEPEVPLLTKMKHFWTNCSHSDSTGVVQTFFLSLALAFTAMHCPPGFDIPLAGRVLNY